jgi:hypothetical protein
VLLLAVGLQVVADLDRGAGRLGFLQQLDLDGTVTVDTAGKFGDPIPLAS